MQKLARVFLCSLVFSTVASVVTAAPILYNIDYAFSGSGTGSVQAEFTEVGDGLVQLRMASTDLSGGYASGWYLNLDTNLDASDLDINYVSGIEADAVGQGTNDFKADGDGFFDLLFSFSTADHDLAPGEWSVYTLALDGLTADAFNFVSVNGPVGKNGFYAAAKISGGGGIQAWVADADGPAPPPVPEPASLLLLGAGALPLIRKRMRRTGQ